MITIGFSGNTYGLDTKSGLTIITHGFNIYEVLAPWTHAMGDGIRDRTNSNNQVYILEVYLDSNNNIVFDGDIDTDFDGIPDIGIGSTGGTTILIDWSSISNDIGTVIAEKYTEAIADAIFDHLFGNSADKFSELDNHFLGEVPIHLIGHSRGASLNTRLAYLFAKNGILVHQQTSLDPHPVNFLNQDDWAMTTYINTVYADNYFRTGLSGFDGESVYGAATYGGFNIKDQIHDDTIFNSECADEHSRVHTYYHGTIDQTAEDDSSCDINNAWYPDDLRDRTGYAFNRAAGVHDGSSPTPFYFSGVTKYINGILTNNYQLNLLQGIGDREGVLFDTNQCWPNVVIYQNDSFPAVASVGESVSIPYYYSDRNSLQTIEFYLDDDTNPYKGDEMHIGTVSNINPILSGRIGSDIFTFVPDAGHVGTGKYIHAKTTNTPDSGHPCAGVSRERHDYVLRPITISTGLPQIPAAPLNVIASNGSYQDKIRVSWDASTGAEDYRVYRCEDSSIASCNTGFVDSVSPFDDTGAVTGITYYYRIQACNSAGCSDWSETDPGYRQAPTSNLPIVDISIFPPTVEAGSSISIDWSSSNATSCYASGAWFGQKDISGSETSFPGGTTTYTLTCSGPSGTASDSESVTVTGVVQPQVLIDASELVVNSGEPVYLAWASGGATYCEASGGWSGSFGTSGTYQVNPASTTTYTVDCFGPGGSDNDSVTITVGNPNPVRLEAVPSTLYDGDSSTLTWSTQGMSSCNATWSGTVSTNGSQSVSPTSDMTYTVTCQEANGSTEELVDNGAFSGTVNEWTVSGDFYADSFYGGCLSCPGYAYLAAPDGTLSSSNNRFGTLYQNITIPSDASSAVLEYWVSISTQETRSTPSDVLYASIRNASGSSILETVSTHSNLDAGGYQRITYDLSDYIGQTVQLYFLGSTNSSLGTIFRLDDVSVEVELPNTYSDDATITVLDPLEPTLIFNANPNIINLGESLTLSWSATDTTDCDATDGWTGSKQTSDSQSVSPIVNTMYTLACEGTGGSIERSVSVAVVQPQPTIDFTATPSTIDFGSTSTLSWSTTNASSCAALGAWSEEGVKPTSGTQNVSPVNTSTYGLSCNGTGGSVETIATITVNPPPDEPEINISGNGVSIADGDNTPESSDNTQFSGVDITDTAITHTFYIHNIGTQPLFLTGAPLLSVGGQHASDFYVSKQPAATIEAGGYTIFQLTFESSEDGVRNATITIENNDTDENLFNFSIQGVGINSETTPLMERVSVDSNGNESNGSSSDSSISGDGRYVTFDSGSDSLVAGDTNQVDDIFVHDRLTNTTTRVSISSEGVQGNDDSRSPSIDSSGRYVAFQSRATNLITGDTNDEHDIFVHDRQTGTTERVSVFSGGTESSFDSYDPSISADGRYVAFRSGTRDGLVGTHDNIFIHDRQSGETMLISIALSGTSGGNNDSTAPSVSGDGRLIVFESRASNLVAGDVTGTRDIFLHDRQNDSTQRINVSSEGVVGDGSSRAPSISDDGRYVAFYSSASNLVSDDTNSDNDIFVHDLQTGTTERVSISSDGTEGNGNSYDPSISTEGRYVTFESDADNLVEEDTGERDIFVHDRQMGTTKKISITSNGELANGSSTDPFISADGRFVAFRSIANNLVGGDNNVVGDIFVRDREKNPPPPSDLDEDGIFDNQDNCIEVANADQRDTDVDGYGNMCDGDLNNDGIVNALDLGLFKQVFITNDPHADFNSDGIVNALDLGLFKQMFIKPPGPSANTATDG